MMELTLSEIEAAAKRIEKIVRKTPMTRSSTFSRLMGADIYLKCENQQKTGSFKIRGASNKISKLKNQLSKNKTFITASAGNHAQGVAYAATCCGFSSIVVMPKFAPLAKIDATRGYGAKVELKGECFDDAYAYATKLDGIFIHPYDDLDVIAGQGTLGLEILKELPDVDIVLIPAGGGGLLSGIACAIKNLKPRVKVIGVQAQNANAIVKSFNAKKRICTKNSNTLADGIAVKNPGYKTVDIINKYVDDMICVPDHDIASAVLSLLERSKFVVEPAGATSVAALFTKNSGINFKNKKIVSLLSGGNIDVNTISSIIEHGLVARSRIVEFMVIAPEQPQSIKNIFNIIVDNGANILATSTDKLARDCGIGFERIYVCCETNGKKHRDSLLKKLQDKNYIIVE